MKDTKTGKIKHTQKFRDIQDNFSKDMLLKIFHDHYYYSEKRQPYASTQKIDNFAYVRLHEDESRYSDIIERILMFLVSYPTFMERTGLGFMELMMMDPSTTTYIQNTWIEAMKPELAKSAEQEKEMKKLGSMSVMLQKMMSGK